jgi:hypothetical protein
MVPFASHPDSAHPALDRVAAALDPILTPLALAPAKQAYPTVMAR